MLTSYLTTTFVVSDRVQRADMDQMRGAIAAMQAELVALRELLQAREVAQKAPEGEREDE